MVQQSRGWAVVFARRDGLLGRIVARANVEEAREDRGGVNNVVAAGIKRVDQQHEQTGLSGEERDK
uniref:Uncharacterized protein n=1 Tax=Hyaloperonospora arabidopsidis (strain Emoy2) TaxID=559515 RepID=M4BIM4_HYAAE